MAQIGTMSVKVDADVKREIALTKAVEFHSGHHVRVADDVVATAEKFHAFLNA